VDDDDDDATDDDDGGDDEVVGSDSGGMLRWNLLEDEDEESTRSVESVESAARGMPKPNVNANRLIRTAILLVVLKGSYHHITPQRTRWCQQHTISIVNNRATRKKEEGE